VGSDLDLAIPNLLDLDSVTEVANTAVDLDLVLEELLEGADVEDLVAGGLRSVDDELRESSDACPFCFCRLHIAPNGRQERDNAYLARHLGLLALGS
jgi:hypothetical protein